jgi:hypothetical protein
MAEFDAEYCAQQLRKIAHPHRLHLVACLLDGPATAAELAERIGADTETLEAHLQYLIDANLAELEGPSYRLRAEVSIAWLTMCDTGTIDLGCCKLHLDTDPPGTS